MSGPDYPHSINHNELIYSFQSSAGGILWVSRFGRGNIDTVQTINGMLSDGRKTAA